MSIRLLIVEQDGAIAEIARRALAPAEWRVATEDDPHKALFGVSAVTPDLIVCAAELAGMSGVEFAREVKSIPVASHLPVVLVGDGEGAEGVFLLPAGVEPQTFANALYDALAEIDLDGEEMAEAIELEEAFGEMSEAQVESVELTESEGEIFDLSTAEEGLELLESIEMPEDESEFLLEPTEIEPVLEPVGPLQPEPVLEINTEQVEREMELPVADIGIAAAIEETLEAERFSPPVEEELPSEDERQIQSTVEAEALSAVRSAEVPEIPQAALDAMREAVAGAVARTLDPGTLSELISASVEKIVWEVVPPLAEKLILEAIEKLKNPPQPE